MAKADQPDGAAYSSLATTNDMAKLVSGADLKDLASNSPVARAATGHAAAPPSNVMNSRRLTADASRAPDRKDSTPRQQTAASILLAERDDRDHATENFFKEVAQNRPPHLPRQQTSLTTKNRFTRNFRGWRPG